MSSLFPKSLKQFGIARLLAAPTSIAVALAITSFVLLPLIVVLAYWLSQALFHISDTIDNRQLDDRRAISSCFNLFGLATALVAIVGGISAVLQLGLIAIGIFVWG